ncbi:MAG: alpha/beta hydrolase [Parvularculaceae bacterium]|nr:alpha/beta hydrolase [Parvularculaceae bacterium]
MFKRLILALAAVSLLGGAAAAWLVWRAQNAPVTASAALMSADDRLMTIAGANVRVRIEGPEEGAPIILLHGFIYSLESFDAWAADLSRDHRVIRFDLLGHGLSGPDPQKRYSPQERAEFIGDIMDALNVERAVVGGNSLGGLAAWRFAAASPERVTGVVLVSPGAYPDRGISDVALSPPAPFAFFLRNPTQAGVALTLQGVYADKAMITPARVERVTALMRQPGNGDAFVESIEEFTLPDPEPLLKSIKAPVLILWGAEDKVIPAEYGRRMEAAIPDASLVVYEGVGHVAQEEAPERSIADVRAFLTRVEGAAP